jgi:hypothetical protein
VSAELKAFESNDPNLLQAPYSIPFIPAVAFAGLSGSRGAVKSLILFKAIADTLSGLRAGDQVGVDLD